MHREFSLIVVLGSTWTGATHIESATGNRHHTELHIIDLDVHRAVVNLHRETDKRVGGIETGRIRLVWQKAQVGQVVDNDLLALAGLYTLAYVATHILDVVAIIAASVNRRTYANVGIFTEVVGNCHLLIVAHKGHIRHVLRPGKTAKTQ